MDNIIEGILLDKARKAMENARCPFSGFRVGAALLGLEENIYTGCNIENPSLGLSICAERVALLKALSEGEQLFKKLTVVADNRLLTYPCGSCRQIIWEFSPDIEIILGNLDGMIKRMSIRELLPFAFDYRVVRGEHSNEAVKDLAIGLGDKFSCSG